MTLGLPRALLHYYYYPFWHTLFTELGFDVVLSDETNTKVMTEGVKVTVSELCVPIKIFNGHVLNLLQKNVDFVFIPQFLSMGKEWYCPKFLGLPEIATYSIEGLKEKAVVIPITSKTDVISKRGDYSVLCEKFGFSRAQLNAALKKAERAFLQHRDLCKQGYTTREAFDLYDGKEVLPLSKEGELTVALLGYVNNVYDDFVSMKAVSNLRAMNVRVITFDMLDEALLRRPRNGRKKIFWVYARKIYLACQHLLKQGELDGIIHLTAFCCGPDSVIGKLMELDCEQAGVPFMTLRVDEHTGESHVQTRLEAFVDMLKMSKQTNMLS